MDNFQKTWEEIVELKAKVNALERKAQIREIHCDVIDKLAKVSDTLKELEEMMTDISNGDY
jgi:hypothetical protein